MQTQSLTTNADLPRFVKAHCLVLSCHGAHLHTQGSTKQAAPFPLEVAEKRPLSDHMQTLPLLQYADLPCRRESTLPGAAACRAAPIACPHQLLTCHFVTTPWQVLSRHGAHLHTQGSSEGRTSSLTTPLHIAAMRGNVRIVKAVLRAYVSPAPLSRLPSWYEGSHACCVTPGEPVTSFTCSRMHIILAEMPHLWPISSTKCADVVVLVWEGQAETACTTLLHHRHTFSCSSVPCICVQHIHAVWMLYQTESPGRYSGV